jgi:hypothetical protein
MCGGNLGDAVAAGCRGFMTLRILDIEWIKAVRAATEHFKKQVIGHKLLICAAISGLRSSSQRAGSVRRQ